VVLNVCFFLWASCLVWLLSVPSDPNAVRERSPVIVCFKKEACVDLLFFCCCFVFMLWFDFFCWMVAYWFCWFYGFCCYGVRGFFGHLLIVLLLCLFLCILFLLRLELKISSFFLFFVRPCYGFRFYGGCSSFGLGRLLMGFSFFMLLCFRFLSCHVPKV
jgi:hypothetical protein